MTTNEYFIYVKDNLKEVDGITFKKMMGEYLLYYKGLLIGGLYDNRLLIKKTERSDKLLYGCPLVMPYETAKSFMYEVDVDDVKDKRRFFDLLI